MVEKILNNTTPYGKIRASHEGSLRSSTLKQIKGSIIDYSEIAYIDFDIARYLDFNKIHKYSLMSNRFGLSSHPCFIN